MLSIHRNQGKKSDNIYIYIYYIAILLLLLTLLLLLIFALLFNHSLVILMPTGKTMCYIATFLYITYLLHLPLAFFFDILTPIATRGYPTIRWDDIGAYVADGKRYFPSLRDLWNIFNSLEVTADRSCRSDPFQPQWSMMGHCTLFICHMCV